MNPEENTTTPEKIQEIQFPGSLRDWFAGMAMQGAAMYVNEHADVDGRGDLAKSCYAIADAMLLVRLKNEALRAGE